MSFNKRGWRGDKFSERIGNEGTERRVKDTATLFRDSEGRTINISPAYGVQVEDSQGTIIHDTPDCVIASDMRYGGHIYWEEQSTNIDTIGVDVTSDGAAYQDTDLSNVDLSAHLPSDLTNLSGALVYSFLDYELGTAKFSNIASCLSITRYCMDYNSTDGALGNIMHYNYIFPPSTGSNTPYKFMGQGVQQVIPITWDGGTPYIMRMYNSFIHEAVNGKFKCEANLQLLGYVV